MAPPPRKFIAREYTRPEEQPTATVVFYVIGVALFVVAFIAGIVLGNVETGISYGRTEFSFAIALAYWATGFISGMVFIGVGIVIQSLYVCAWNSAQTAEKLERILHEMQGDEDRPDTPSGTPAKPRADYSAL